MIIKKNIFAVILLFLFSGCYQKPSYEFFKENKDIYMHTSDIPNMFYYKREIYDNNRYIYRFEHPAGCHYGYLTNRDGKPERVIDWIILSGKEYCKETPGIGTLI
ncbi:hypothetical protein [Campylobacter hyointestinalis]|uniref:hypothetical protein n=1 Tax=Campylobacter hyointestinalis TaxID=198 RepID=UPI000CE49ED7|nr:hypothetical protein [Campylobacter hyointestinalis]PPB51200.1 hypothetical protein CDQ68_08575 [Campylobacter hyointestinalis subsp. hyointestinalis]PPB65614.1 hypothetical protein CDQ75_08925 [Campylobacter hyointestinalis subsp. hyointestinalis]PPB68051.1 hypothetical protein CDQ77_08515 [Campylobacter hyointestinalis subsp. hyointestinalis]